MRARFVMPALPFAFAAIWIAACGGLVPTATPAPAAPEATGGPTSAPTQAPPTSTTAAATPDRRTPEPTATATFAMDDDGCAFSGPATLAAGPGVLGLENESSGQFDADLWLLHPGHDYDELAAHAAEEQRRWHEGLPPLGHPAFATLVAEASVSGREGTMAVPLVAGTYGLACIRFIAGAPVDIWAAGPLTIAD